MASGIACMLLPVVIPSLFPAILGLAVLTVGQIGVIRFDRQLRRYRCPRCDLAIFKKKYQFSLPHSQYPQYKLYF